MDASEIKYSFTRIGSSVGCRHGLFLVLLDNTIVHASEFNNSNLLDFKEDLRFKLSDIPEEIKAAQGGIYGINGDNLDFELFVEDNNEYNDSDLEVLYKSNGFSLDVILSSDDRYRCPAMDYVFSLYTFLTI